MSPGRGDSTTPDPLWSAQLVVARTLPARSVVVRDERFGWVVGSPDGELRALDDRLADLARFRLPRDALGAHGVSPDLDVAAVAATSRVVAIDRAGNVVWEVAHLPWGRGGSERGSCWFSADGLYIWAHVPSNDGPDEWLLIDARDGALAGRSRLSCYSAGSRVIRHPDGRRVGLSVGEGQDGSETYFGWVADGEPIVERFDDRSRVLVAFSPDGRHFMTTPHSVGPIRLHRVSDGESVASLDPGDVLPGDQPFDLYGGFVDGATVLFASPERDEVFTARLPDLDGVASIDLPIRRAGQFVGAFRGGVLTSDWATGETMVWRLVRRDGE